MLEFTRTNFNEERVAFIGNFENFRPSKAIDTKSIDMKRLEFYDRYVIEKSKELTYRDKQECQKRTRPT